MLKVTAWLAVLKAAKNSKHEKVKRVSMENFTVYIFYDME